MVDPTHMIATPEDISLQYLRFRREGSAMERASAARRAFTEWIAQHQDAPVSPRWAERDGAEADAICAEAKTFDLLVIPRGTNLDGRDALHTVSYCAQRPFIVAPASGAPRPGSHLADCIVIAWNGTPACRRAAEAARPFLAQSTRAVMLLITEGAEVAQNLASDLRRDGIVGEIRTIARDAEKLGDQIVSEALALGATLLVMGAHRHSAWIEWITGHTTDQALRHEDITFFMAH
jgi:hypothetical protein